jgi:hypothetical protein
VGGLLPKFFVGVRMLQIVLEQHIMELQELQGMRTLNTLFRSAKESTSMPSQSLFPSPSILFFETQNPSLITEEATRNLQIRLKEINQQCSITKSAKTNKNIFTYDYLRCLDIYSYH